MKKLMLLCAAACLLAPRVFGARVPAAPRPVYEIEATVKSVKTESPKPRARPKAAPAAHRRVRVTVTEIRQVTVQRWEQVPSSPDELSTPVLAAPRLSMEREGLIYGGGPELAPGDVFTGRVRYGGDERLHGYFLFDVRTGRDGEAGKE